MWLRSFSKTLATVVAAICFFAGSGLAETDTKVEHDRSRLSVFAQPSVSFLSFDQRKYFQAAIDTIYQSFREDALTASESLNVAKQDFQKVNFCFPVSAGIQYQVIQDHFISAGIGFIYDNESVVLADRKNRTHNYSYTIQGVPFFLEYRLGIPKNFMSLSGESLFSIAIRWYWILPGTEIYTTWGKLEAETPMTGSGYGVSLGYLVASWKNFKVYGDVGFSSISVKSKKSFADIVPDGPEGKAHWNVGGLQMQIRVSFGLINDPEPVEDDDDDDDDKPKAEGGKTLPMTAPDTTAEKDKTAEGAAKPEESSAPKASENGSAADATTAETPAAEKAVTEEKPAEAKETQESASEKTPGK